MRDSGGRRAAIFKSISPSLPPGFSWSTRSRGSSRSRFPRFSEFDFSRFLYTSLSSSLLLLTVPYARDRNFLQGSFPFSLSLSFCEDTMSTKDEFRSRSRAKWKIVMSGISWSSKRVVLTSYSSRQRVLINAIDASVVNNF